MGQAARSDGRMWWAESADDEMVPTSFRSAPTVLSSPAACQLAVTPADPPGVGGVTAQPAAIIGTSDAFPGCPTGAGGDQAG
ncbi:hypothetical protein Vse01_24590 [Micromonospora sediminimaris]|uniref:Uncharacterized protein n=1 Tax=Micromonospora sediminimaris TaxID=547162 RepID=A0A9W5URX1_9ACTN|nr:hypothetical protein Vse01_24590 [Micromonospora sediminimaris]